MAKVAIIGAGNVGAVAAYCVAEADLAEVTLIDVVKDMPQDKARDLGYAAPAQRFHARIGGSNDMEEIRDADIVVHTAGLPRKPGMDRMDLLKINVGIARTTAAAILRYAPESIIIAVANPLDVIAMALYRDTAFAAHRVIGMAGILDSTRFRYFIAERLGVWPGDIQALVLGGHGDSMVPLPRYTTVGGVPLPELLSAEEIEALVQRTRTGGGEIVGHLKTGGAYYAPGSSVALMVKSILTGTRRIEPCSAYLQGEYGHSGIFLGVPALIGSKGVEEIIELQLDEPEQAALDASAKQVHRGVEMLDAL